MRPPGLGAASTAPASAAATIWLPSGPTIVALEAGPLSKAPGAWGPASATDRGAYDALAAHTAKANTAS